MQKIDIGTTGKVSARRIQKYYIWYSRLWYRRFQARTRMPGTNTPCRGLAVRMRSVNASAMDGYFRDNSYGTSMTRIGQVVTELRPFKVLVYMYLYVMSVPVLPILKLLLALSSLNAENWYRYHWKGLSETHPMVLHLILSPMVPPVSGSNQNARD